MANKRRKKKSQQRAGDKTSFSFSLSLSIYKISSVSNEENTMYTYASWIKDKIFVLALAVLMHQINYVYTYVYMSIDPRYQSMVICASERVAYKPRAFHLYTFRFPLGFIHFWFFIQTHTQTHIKNKWKKRARCA